MSKVAETIPVAAKAAKAGKPFFDKKGDGMFAPGESSFFNGQMLQKKLSIGQPNDKYEQEADAVADTVVQKLGENTVVQPKTITPVPPMLQEKCDACEKEEENQQDESAADDMLVQKKPIFESDAEDHIQRKCAACEEEEKIQKKEDTASMETAPESIENRLAAASGGSSLPEPVRTSMESSIGADFSQVKVHTGSHAVQLSKELHAQAFTHGNDIYFNNGKYNPDTKDGQHLLAHELTHTVQQGKSIQRSVTETPAIQKLGDVTQVPAGMTCEVASDSPGGVTDITFATSSDVISAPQRGMLNGFVRGWHAGGGNMNIRLDGYASTDGPDALNWQLSCARANAVRSALEHPSDGSPGIATGFITLFAQGETSEFGVSLAANRKVIISSVARPVPVPAFRTETTDFGTYEVYPDTFIGPMLPNQLRETDFQRLQRNWNSMVANTGGMITNGTDPDRQALRTVMRREIPRSMTFRNLFIEIVEDPLRPVIINVGRNNANRVDQFNNNNLDLNDLSLYEESPRPGYEWAQTQGEILIHVLSERRFAAVNGRANFRPAHDHPLAAGGDQENFRRDLGQTGRVVSQIRNTLPNGLQEAVATDTNGNILRWRLDPSGGDPVAFEIAYEPAAGAAVAAVHTRTNFMRVQVNSNAAAGENLFVRFSAAGRTANTAALAVSAGASQQFQAGLGTLVPAGATIQVLLFRNNAAGPATQIATLNWAHPFDNANLQANAGATIYNLNVSLQMSN